LDGLKDKPRSRRPPLLKHDLMIKIRKELEDGDTGWWDFRQAMCTLYKRELVSNIKKYIYLSIVA